MNNRTVVGMLLKKLALDDGPNSALYQDMALQILQRRCHVNEQTEIPDDEVDDFLLNISNSAVLGSQWISVIQDKMLISKLSDPDLILSASESNHLDRAIDNLSFYLERVAAIIITDGHGAIEEKDFSRLGLDKKEPIKILLERCPLIEKKGDGYIFKNQMLQNYFGVKLMGREANSKVDRDNSIRLGMDGKWFFPLPVRRPKPWEVLPVQQGVAETDLVAPAITQSASLAAVNQPTSSATGKLNLLDDIKAMLLRLTKMMYATEDSSHSFSPGIKDRIEEIHHRINESDLISSEKALANYFGKQLRALESSLKREATYAHNQVDHRKTLFTDVLQLVKEELSKLASHTPTFESSAKLPGNEQSKIISPASSQHAIKEVLNTLRTCQDTLNDAQIKKISDMINQLKKEISGSGLFNFNKNRKKEKITALNQLLKNCREGMPIEDAVNKARESPGVIEGRLSKRVAQLLEDLAPSEGSALIKKT